MKVNPSKFKPFMLITREDEKVVIVAGNVQVSPMAFDNEEQAEDYLTTQPYEMFTNLYSIFRYYEKENAEKTEKVTQK